MPTPEQILGELQQIAREWRGLAVLWHGYFGAVTLALGFGLRPSKRIAGVLLAMPLLSVSILAWMTGNPFNGTLFGLSSIGLVGISLGLGPDPVRIGPLWSAGAGALLFVFGWIYPHFLGASSIVPYVYSAPTGLIPCPTLSIVIGLALILGGLGSRSWSLLAGLLGVFYGLFGAVRLGVTIDWFLAAGSFMILLLPMLGLTEESASQSAVRRAGPLRFLRLR